MESLRSPAWLSRQLTLGQLLPARQRLGTHSLVTPPMHKTLNPFEIASVHKI